MWHRRYYPVHKSTTLPISKDISPLKLWYKALIPLCCAGLLAEKMFGFDQEEIVAGGTSHNLENAGALSSALLVCLVVPWGLCFIFYFGNSPPYIHQQCFTDVKFCRQRKPKICLSCLVLVSRCWQKAADLGLSRMIIGTFQFFVWCLNCITFVRNVHFAPCTLLHVLPSICKLTFRLNLMSTWDSLTGHARLKVLISFQFPFILFHSFFTSSKLVAKGQIDGHFLDIQFLQGCIGRTQRTGSAGIGAPMVSNGYRTHKLLFETGWIVVLILSQVLQPWTYVSRNCSCFRRFGVWMYIVDWF